MFNNFVIYIKKNKYLWYSFGIPLVLMLVLFFVEEIIPFGLKSATLYDSSHQYVPFLTEYYTKLKNGSSMQFSMSMGLGQDFWLIWSYYLSSPINLLLLLFSKEDIVLAINLITILKISLCSFTATYYLKKRFNKIDISTLSFGLCYGLSAYVMSYFCNIMWMDVIFAFPLLILYFEKMIKNEKYSMLKYSIVLGYCIIANFYLSIPVCIFLFLYFFVYSENELKSFLIKGIKFAFSSLIGAGLAGIVLFPNIYYFLSSPKEEMESAGFEIMENFFIFLSRHLYLTNPQVDMSFKSGGNLYCGTFIIFLLFLFIFNKQVKKSERIKKLILIIFLILSMNIKVLNFIWHGFDYPTGYVNRFSFIYIFLLISIGYECFMHIRKFKITHIMIATTFSLLYVIYCFIYENTHTEIDYYKTMSYILTASILIIYTIPIFLNHFNKIKKKTLISLISKLMICELCFYGIFAFSSYGFMNMDNSYKYADNYKKLIPLVNDDKEMCRSDIDYRKLSNESTQYGLNGISFFSSTVDRTFASVINRLGHRAGTNFMSIKGNNNLTQLLFNIKYLYNESIYYSNFESIDSDGNIYLYKNNYDTSYGYLFEPSFIDFNYNTSNNPFKMQNDLVKAATNGKVPFIYKSIVSEKVKASSSGINFTSGSYTYNKDVTNNYMCRIEYEKEKDIIYELNLKYICENENDIVINIDPSNVHACNVKINGNIAVSDYKIANEMITIGNLKAGDEINVNVKIKEDATSGKITCYFAEYDATCFDKFYEYISENPVTFTNFEDGNISLNVNNTEEKVLFLSIPYSKGWKATDNMKEIDILNENSFILLKLSPGEHNIKLKYSTPMLNYGIISTILSSLILILLLVISKKEKGCGMSRAFIIPEIQKETES